MQTECSRQEQYRLLAEVRDRIARSPILTHDLFRAVDSLVRTAYGALADPRDPNNQSDTDTAFADIECAQRIVDLLGDIKGAARAKRRVMMATDAIAENRQSVYRLRAEKAREAAADAAETARDAAETAADAQTRADRLTSLS